VYHSAHCPKGTIRQESQGPRFLRATLTILGCSNSDNMVLDVGKLLYLALALQINLKHAMAIGE
jgi:hypothetical protein